MTRGARVTYTYNGELGGALPAVFVERAWRAEAPRLLRRLADTARRRQPLRAQPSGSET